MQEEVASQDITRENSEQLEAIIEQPQFQEEQYFQPEILSEPQVASVSVSKNFVKESGSRTTGVERKNVFKAVYRHLLKLHQKNRKMVLDRLQCTQEYEEFLDKACATLRQSGDRKNTACKKDYRKVLNVLAANDRLLPLLLLTLESMCQLYYNDTTRLKAKNRQSYINALEDMYETAYKWHESASSNGYPTEHHANDYASSP